ncbi:DUF3795 domain-containing protein [bacterium]|nr:MAG: DUF3795 domain-containing protein [bacterium]
MYHVLCLGFQRGDEMRHKQSTKPLVSGEINADWIAYCGHYCGNCHLYKGEIADMAKELLRKLKDPQFQKTTEGVQRISGRFRSLSDYRRFSEMLCELDSLRCTQICRHSDATSNCRVRQCCEKKGIAGCWECEEIESCEVIADLKPDLKLRRIEMFLEIRKVGVQKYLIQAHQRAVDDSSGHILCFDRKGQ